MRKRSTGGIKALGIGLLGATALAASARAQEGETVVLDDVVVTASRVEEAIANVPANATVITAADIASGHYLTVAEALEALAGLHFRTLSTPAQSEVDMRGFGENGHGRVLVLLNGVKLNRPDMASVNWLQVPLTNVERIEVVPGAGSALYGDYAVAGVINIITRGGTEEPTYGVSASAGSDGFNSQSASANGKAGKVAYSASADRQESSGYRDRSAHRTEAGALSLGVEITEDLSLDLALSALNAEYEMPGGLTAAEMDADRTQAGDPANESEEEFRDATLGLDYRLSESSHLRLDGGFSLRELETDIASWGSFIDRDLESASLSPRYILTLPIAGRTNRLALGVDYVNDNADIVRYATAARAARLATIDVDRETLGVYLSSTYQLTESVSVSTGVRTERGKYELLERDGGGALTQEADNTHREEAYHVGLTYRPTEKTKLYGKIDRVFRFPFVDEQFDYQGFGGASNLDLAPEKGVGYEIGISHVFGAGPELSLSVFRLEMEDEIAYQGFAVGNVNLEETVHQGIELASVWAVTESVTLRCTYSLLEAQFDGGANDGKRVPLVPEHNLRIAGEWSPVNGLVLSAGLTYISDMVPGADDANVSEIVDSYAVTDVAATYTIEMERCDVELFAKIDNVFDREYVTAGFWGWGFGDEYYPAPDRTFRAGAAIRF